MLKQLDSGAMVGQMLIITANTAKQTGGEEVELHDVRCTFSRAHAGNTGAGSTAATITPAKKKPGHYENSTRNLVLQNGEIRKTHIRLIRQFNHQTVL